MKKITLFILLCTALLAAENGSFKHRNDPQFTAKPLGERQLRKMDRELNKYKAVQRKFKTQKEFQRMHRKSKKYMHKKHLKARMSKHELDYRYGYPKGVYNDGYRPITQSGYRNFKRGWLLAYKYDKAPFYDQFGYYFEGMFYRFDRYYTYQDRVRGHGMFDNRYYMPANYRYYGFERPRHGRGVYRY